MTILTVHFATNREETGDPAKPFGKGLNAKTPLYLRFGSADIAPPDSSGGAYRLVRLRVAPEAIPGITVGERAKMRLGSDAVFDGLRQRLIANRSDLLLYLHGYANTFEEALQRAAELKHRWSSDARPIEVAAFSWPADGEMVPFLSYASDRDDARSSAKAIARALHRLLDYIRGLASDERCDARMHLCAHSMGNYALRHALQALISDFGGRLPRLFENVFLMAADEDDDALALDAKLARLPDLAHAVHVYMAGNDRALTVSDKTKGNPDRLGSRGPRTLTNLPQKVTLVDCAEVSDTGNFKEANHQYYRKRPEVVADVVAVLAGVPPDRIEHRTYVPEKRAYRIGRRDAQ